MKYSVELHVIQIHDVEVEATSYEDARNKAIQEWKDGYIYNDAGSPTFCEEKAKVVSFTSIPTTEEIQVMFAGGGS